MPQIELILPAGALDKLVQEDLMEKLTSTLLRWEGAPEDSEIAREIAWGYVDERPAERIYQGGKPSPERPLYRIKVTVPERALDDEKKAGVVADMTRHVLEAEGAAPDDDAAAMRVWVVIREVSDGNWGAAGRIFRIRDIAKLIGAPRAKAEEPLARA